MPIRAGKMDAERNLSWLSSHAYQSPDSADEDVYGATVQIQKALEDAKRWRRYMKLKDEEVELLKEGLDAIR